MAFIVVMPILMVQLLMQSLMVQTLRKYYKDQQVTADGKVSLKLL